MEVDIDVYFWLVDRGVYDDDQRNKVDMERNKVRLHREHSQRLENGYYLAKLMMILKKSVVRRDSINFGGKDTSILKLIKAVVFKSLSFETPCLD